MSSMKISKDPYNIIITGVGGQGNVLASRILANMFVENNFFVTIGESFGASQRGGSVMSHLRISKESCYSPQIPKGLADIIVSLEPIEAIRVLLDYGNSDIKVLSNSRPVRPPGVIAGDMNYPSLDEIKISLKELSSDVWIIDATEKAVEMGNPILGNIIMLGALAGVSDLPLYKDDFQKVMSRNISSDKIDINLQAYDLGSDMVNQ